MKERKEGILKHRKYTRGYITNGDLKLQRSSNTKKEQQLTSNDLWSINKQSKKNRTSIDAMEIQPLHKI